MDCTKEKEMTVEYSRTDGAAKASLLTTEA